MVSPKKLHWNMIFFVLSGKMLFLFPENKILPLKRKIKDDLSQKKRKHMEMWYFLQVFWKDDLFKKTAPGHDLSCIIWKDGICFPKNTIFFNGRKIKDDLSQEVHRGTVFYVFTCRRYKRGVRFLFQKNQRWPSPTKIHLKMIDSLGWHSRNGSNNCLYFYGDFYRRFHILPSSEINQET